VISYNWRKHQTVASHRQTLSYKVVMNSFIDDRHRLYVNTCVQLSYSGSPRPTRQV